VQLLGGFYGLLTGRLGSATLTAAGSRRSAAFSDLAGRLRYDTPDSSGGQVNPWRVSLESEYKGPRFAQIGTLVPLNPWGWSLTEYSLYRTRRGIDLGAGVTHRWKRTAAVDRWEGHGDVSLQLSSSWRVSGNYTYVHDALREHRVFLSLTWTERSGRNYAAASYDYSTKTGRLDVIHNPAQPYDDVRLSAGVARSPTNDEASLHANYLAQRAEVQLDHVSTLSRGAGVPTRHLTTPVFATAVAWAGSSVSLSRPITDSFVILPTAGPARGKDIAVNPQGTSAEAYAGGFLPAVLPQVTSYYLDPVSLDATALPVGLSLPEEFFQVKTTYKSGAEITIGGKMTYLASGSLALPGGKPLALASGEVVAAGQTKGPVFFSNRQGRFVVENLEPGKYKLRFYDEDLSDAEFTVPDGANGIVKLGTLNVRKERAQ
jgi:outer membrane usher protein